MDAIVKAVRRRMLGLIEDCSGPTAVEYAVVLGLIVLVSMGAIQAIGVGWQQKIYIHLAQAIPG